MSYAKRGKMEQLDSDAYQAKVMGYAEKILYQIVSLTLSLKLVHGDTNPRNIIKWDNEEFTFFYFEGTVISYPFIDAISFSFVTNGYRSVNAEELSVYVNEWGEYAESDRLGKALKAMNGFEFLMGICLGYDTWKHTEECQRFFAMREMEQSVIFSLVDFV